MKLDLIYAIEIVAFDMLYTILICHVSYVPYHMVHFIWLDSSGFIMVLNAEMSGENLGLEMVETKLEVISDSKFNYCTQI